MAKRKIAVLVASMLMGILSAPTNQASALHSITLDFSCKLTLDPGETMTISAIPPAAGPDRHGSINCGQDKEDNKILNPGGVPIGSHPELYWCRATVVTGVVKKTKPAALPKGPSNSNCTINSSKGTVRIGPGTTGFGPYCDQSSGGIDKAHGIKIRVKLANGSFKWYKIYFDYFHFDDYWWIVGEIQKLLGGPKGPKVQVGAFMAEAQFRPSSEKNRSCFGSGSNKFTLTGTLQAVMTDVNGGKPPGTP